MSYTEPSGALMVCGATSDAGKTTLVTGLCRLLARSGVRVAPFKAQNMALNSAVTPSGHEIGRAQAIQAYAAGVPAEVAMNPILLKPTGERSSQVVVRGEPWRVLSAAAYHELKPALLPMVLDALADLRGRYDVVLCEGAGSPTEINLLDRDIVNLRVADEAGMAAIVVGDINLGGVFASLYGTVALLPDNLRRRVRGLVINKLRGDPDLLRDGCDQLGALTGVPVLGVLPWIDSTGLDAEDSMALEAPRPMAGAALADELDVAVVRFPRISNFTDLDPLSVEPGVRVRLVNDRAGLGDPDLIILPGTKATVDDLAWLRRSGLDDAMARSTATVLGICGGYQMMGAELDDPIESGAGRVTGLGWLPVSTRFESDKVTRLRHGTIRTGPATGLAVQGYQIHHGRVTATGDSEPLIEFTDTPTTAITGDGIIVDRFVGTTLHGLLEADELRRVVLSAAAERRGKQFISAGRVFEDERNRALDELADTVAQHLDLAAIERLIAEAAPARSCTRVPGDAW